MLSSAASTRDTLHGGRTVLWQPARGVGYRVNVDALHLAGFAIRPRPATHAVDLGAGVGAVGLTLLASGSAERVSFVERDPTLASLCARNLEENGYAARAEVVRADVADDAAFAPGTADLVVANPPYLTPGKGRPPAAQVRDARSGALDPFLVRARSLLGRRGRACFVYPARELPALLVASRGAGLEAKRLRFVHAGQAVAARVVLVELLPGKPGGLLVEAPLVEG
ncbi:MAG: methyltransferase [Myxococcales bacterium]|nr:methyltransferase [Myxococcales bacterium]MBL0193703.1 methyltransferase [Myxococcales bacterium]HQY61029.1 methyltransferase [Polyangiaceae bacterium]